LSAILTSGFVQEYSGRILDLIFRARYILQDIFAKGGSISPETVAGVQAEVQPVMPVVFVQAVVPV
jgi:hypothetical protein